MNAKVSLKREKPFPKSISAWPQQIAVVTITGRDGRKAAWSISASVNQDSRCGRTNEPRLHVYTVTGPEKIVKARGHWAKN